jgi:hypothetical protein
MADGSELSRNLRLARPALDPTPEQRARVRAALGARLEREAAQGPSGPRSGAVQNTPRPHVAVVRAVAFVGVGFVLGYWVAETRSTEGRASDTPRPAAAAPAAAEPLVRGGVLREPTAPEPLASERLASEALALEPLARRQTASEPGVEPARASLRDRALPPRSAKLSRPARQRIVTGAAGLGAELALLQRAERAIRSRDGALARSFVAELESRFPETTLREERAAVLVLAGCMLAEPGAVALARDFLARHPGSVYFDRIGALCSVEPANEESGTSASPVPDGSPRRGH